MKPNQKSLIKKLSKRKTIPDLINAHKATTEHTWNPIVISHNPNKSTASKPYTNTEIQKHINLQKKVES